MHGDISHVCVKCEIWKWKRNEMNHVSSLMEGLDRMCNLINGQDQGVEPEIELGSLDQCTLVQTIPLGMKLDCEWDGR